MRKRLMGNVYYVNVGINRAAERAVAISFVAKTLAISSAFYSITH